MNDVMQKAQELAEAILGSDVYNRMRDLEEEAQDDPEASAAMQRMVEKRRRVEELLTTKGMDREELTRASREMKEAETAMNANEKIQALKAARKDFSTMMENVNRILRLVITGEIQEDDVSGGCGGNCAACQGCQ